MPSNQGRIRTKAEVRAKRRTLVVSVQRCEQTMTNLLTELANIAPDDKFLPPDKYEEVRQNNEKIYRRIYRQIDKILELYAQIDMTQWTLLEGEYEWDKPRPRKIKRRRH